MVYFVRIQHLGNEVGILIFIITQRYLLVTAFRIIEYKLLINDKEKVAVKFFNRKKYVFIRGKWSR